MLQHARDCVRAATDAHVLCKVCSINHALALALVAKLYWIVKDHAAVLGVLCLLDELSKVFPGAKQIVMKARSCLPRQLQLQVVDDIPSSSASAWATRRYLEEALFETPSPPQEASILPLQLPATPVSVAAVANTTPPLPALDALGIDRFLEDLAHELPPLGE